MNINRDFIRMDFNTSCTTFRMSFLKAFKLIMLDSFQIQFSLCDSQNSGIGWWGGHLISPLLSYDRHERPRLQAHARSTKPKTSKFHSKGNNLGPNPKSICYLKNHISHGEKNLHPLWMQFLVL